jgi:hypothetical protein
MVMRYALRRYTGQTLVSRHWELAHTGRNSVDTTAGKTTPRLIAMAVSLVGETHKVADEMRCSNADFLAYCEGKKEPPWPELDRLISLIIREQGLIIARNREFLAKARVKHEQKR